MRQTCWIRPPAARNELRDLFTRLGQEVARYYEDNPRDREEHLDGRLAALLENLRVEQMERRIAEVRESAGLVPLQLRIKVKHITPKEPRHGADIGLVTQITVPGELDLQKAVLVQSKRLYPGRDGRFTRECHYDELFRLDPASPLPPQWERLLAQTSDAVYLLYGPERVPSRQSLKPLGLRIMDARVIKGRFDAGQSRLAVDDAVRLSADFGEWMVDEFLCCGTGDPQPELIRTALGGNPEFPVRHVFQIDIYADEDLRSRFARTG